MSLDLTPWLVNTSRRTGFAGGPWPDHVAAIKGQQKRILETHSGTGWEFENEKSFRLAGAPGPDDAPQSMRDLSLALLRMYPAYGSNTAVLPDGSMHWYLTSNGYKPEGEYPVNPQLFFDERSAVIAYWFHLWRIISDIEFDRDVAIQGIYWREDPELIRFRGTYRVLTRQTLLTLRSDALPSKNLPAIVMMGGKWTELPT